MNTYQKMEKKKMIKVIKHGQKPKFKKVCSNCGCEFEYEQEDVITDYNWNLNSLTWTYPRRIKRVVICPDCGEKLLHDTIIDDQDWYPPNITYTLTGSGTTAPWPDCDKCLNKPDPTKTIVGDTPCTWCIKNRPYCYTGDVFPKDYKGGEYKATCFAGPYKWCRPCFSGRPISKYRRRSSGRRRRISARFPRTAHPRRPAASGPEWRRPSVPKRVFRRWRRRCRVPRP